MKAIRKWEWIRDYCIQQGFTKSAEIADQIDRVLCYLYGNNDTSQWKEFIAGMDKDKIVDMPSYAVTRQIISNSKFCIACQIRTYRGFCSDCDFAALVGGCRDESSLFGEFIDVFYYEEEEEG